MIYSDCQSIVIKMDKRYVSEKNSRIERSYDANSAKADVVIHEEIG